MKKVTKFTKEEEAYRACRDDWRLFASCILGVRLDPEQQQILRAVQNHRRVSVRSGHARGKDYIAAVAATCFLYSYIPSKVIVIAPTQRQVDNILMPEIARIHKNARFSLAGKVLKNKIETTREDWHLLAFNTDKHRHEVWTGYHSPNIMVIVSEASGIDQQVFDNIDGILTGNSRLFLVFNPHRSAGEAYQSTRSPLYVHFHLNCLKAPNVVAQRQIYPGQVDWRWTEDMVQKNCQKIGNFEENNGADENDNTFFQWNGNFYIPNDIFRVRVMGEFPQKDSDQVIPLNWVEAANESWQKKSPAVLKDPLRLGVDVAGIGTDKTVLVHRYGNYVAKVEVFLSGDHMELAGKIKSILDKNPESIALIDTIGEGAGVLSRLKEDGAKVYGAKFSEHARKKNGKELTDITGQPLFANKRAYCWWAVRDALNPQNDIHLTLPIDEGLKQDLTEPRSEFRSDGRLIIEEKSEIRKRLGRSTDFGDALALTYYPEIRKAPISYWTPNN